ncbi:nitronate monooxygenase [Williamsia sterculiae]|uniref:Propionate 3-nitronate monooxygenase n=1 Tax=Williamsia sterculiae TaxID=1344003 RepID=A0A1N7FGE5_9NOCA|nr:nitronate monooxygenase [Williamsia sterculiae]SIR99373.1 nitroalkane oxidase [Williamsia sterculiae]
MTFTLDELSIPILGAPMAGGPSTVELVAAVSGVGGLGMLPTAYASPEETARRIGAVRELGCVRFGVNIFVVGEHAVGREALERYRDTLVSAAPDDVTIPPVPDFGSDDERQDHYAAKVRVAADAQVPLVTFTFGLPSESDVAVLHDRDVAIGVTVTTADDARRAVDRGADLLVVQGPDAGGHRSTFRPDEQPPTQPLPELLAEITGSLSTPAVAAGGVAGGTDVARLLDAGARAVSVGTLLLRTPEAGTKALHRTAMMDPAFTTTAVTWAYSGRPARGIANRFMTDFADVTPAAYPEVNTLTGPIRAAAERAEDPQSLNMWAGTGFRAATDRPAGEVVTELWSRAEPLLTRSRS